MLDAYHSGSVNENTNENKTLDRIQVCARYNADTLAAFLCCSCVNHIRSE